MQKKLEFQNIECEYEDIYISYSYDEKKRKKMK
jgi:hypothetical protein